MRGVDPLPQKASSTRTSPLQTARARDHHGVFPETTTTDRSPDVRESPPFEASGCRLSRPGLCDRLEHMFDPVLRSGAWTSKARSSRRRRPGCGSLAAAERHPLTRGAWVDVRRDFVTGADDVLERLVADVPWRAERRQMYERMVDVPRLVHTYGEGEPLPHPLLDEARDALSEHYRPELGEPFRHSRLLLLPRRPRQRRLARRPLRPRTHPRHDGRDRLVRRPATTRAPTSRRRRVAVFEMGHGDLLVMGGSCQRTWEHAVPKVSQAGPRISVQFRPRGVF